MNQIRISGPFHVRGFLAVAQLGSTVFFSWIPARLLVRRSRICVRSSTPSQFLGNSPQKNESFKKWRLVETILTTCHIYIYIYDISYDYIYKYVSYLHITTLLSYMRTPRKIHTCLFFVPCWVVEFSYGMCHHARSPTKLPDFFSEGQRFTANELTTPPKKKQPSLQYGSTTNACFNKLPTWKNTCYIQHIQFFLCLYVMPCWTTKWNVCWPIGSYQRIEALQKLWKATLGGSFCLSWRFGGSRVLILQGWLEGRIGWSLWRYLN